MEGYKKLVTEFLNEDFVENYAYHRECMELINLDLLENSVPFQYTYNEYCIELLERFKRTVDQYFSTKETTEDFFDCYDDIVFNTFEQMKLAKKLLFQEDPS